MCWVPTCTTVRMYRQRTSKKPLAVIEQPWRCVRHGGRGVQLTPASALALKKRFGRGHRRLQTGHRPRRQFRLCAQQSRGRSVCQGPRQRGHRRLPKGHRQQPKRCGLAYDNLGLALLKENRLDEGHRRPPHSGQNRLRLLPGLQQSRTRPVPEERMGRVHRRVPRSDQNRSQTSTALLQPRQYPACQEAVGRGHRRLPPGHRLRRQVRAGPLQPGIYPHSEGPVRGGQDVDREGPTTVSPQRFRTADRRAPTGTLRPSARCRSVLCSDILAGIAKPADNRERLSSD